MFRRLLVPTDGSAFANRALPYAAGLARHTGAEVVLLHASRTAAASASDPVLDDLVQALNRQGLRARRSLTPGGAQGIAELVHSGGVDLVVMATHGRAGLARALRGSVTDTVARSAPVPVLVIPPGAQARPREDVPLTVLVGLDGSPAAEAALRPATELARALFGCLVLGRVVEPVIDTLATSGSGVFVPLVSRARTASALAEAERELQALAARLQQSELPPCRVRVIEGEVVGGLMQLAAEECASVIAVATHGRGGMRRALLGSVASGLCQRAAHPILVVRAPAGVTATTLAAAS